MKLFNKLFKKIDSEEVHDNLRRKNAAKNSFLFVIGTLISALSFNLFFLPYNFVSGGLGGLAIIINNFFPDINTYLIILIGNLLFISISVITLGWKESIMSAMGAMFYIAFAFFTQSFPELINFSFDNVLLYLLAAAVVSGFGEALVYKSGFNTGGTSILARVFQKYTKLPMGVLIRYMAYFVIIFGGIAFGYTAIMYSLIITTISTYLVDKMLIGISESKTFFIQTDKEDEVIDFIIKIIESGVTELDTKGGYSHKKKKMLMCVVPTDKYGVLKSAIQEIDPNAFIVVSDCYEVLGGTKRKKLLFDN